jgi:hypothetical protein
MKTYRTSEIKRAAQAISNLPTPSDKEVSTLEAVRMLAPTIERARKQGHKIEEILESLAKTGLDISLPTINRYLLMMKAEGSEGSAAAGKPRSKRGKRRDAAPTAFAGAAKTNAVAMTEPDPPRGSFVPREDTEEI